MKVSCQVHAPAPMTICGQTEIPHYFTMVHHRYSAPLPSAKVSGDTNVDMSDIAPCLAAVNECSSVGWDFYLARQQGSASAVCPQVQYLPSAHYRYLPSTLPAAGVCAESSYIQTATDVTTPASCRLTLHVSSYQSYIVKTIVWVI
jgi:hypothetical protein